MTKQTWGLLIILSVLWGASFLFVAIALPTYPPLTIVAFRVVSAAIVLHFVIYFSSVRWPTEKRFVVDITIMGLLNNVIPFALIAWGQLYVASGLASVFNAMTPIFTLVVAHYFIAEERLTGLKISGAAMGLVGVIVLIGYDALAGLSQNVTGQLAIVAAAVSYAFAGVWAKKRLGSYPPLTLATGQVTASAFILSAIALMVDGAVIWTNPHLDILLVLVALGIFSTALAYIIYFRILALAGASNLLLVTFLIPISAIAAGIVVLDESLKNQHIAGIICIAIGLALIDGRLFRRTAAR